MSTIIGIKELHRNLKRVADAALKGASFTVVRDSRPVFHIEPAHPNISPGKKRRTMEDFFALAVKTGDPDLSKKVDDIVYGPRRGGTIDDFLKRASFRSKDKNLSKKVDEIVYGNHR